jgi:hypothetical protein
MKPEWILVGNAAHARLFRRDSPGEPLVPLATLEHPERRLAGRQLAEIEQRLLDPALIYSASITRTSR